MGCPAPCLSFCKSHLFWSGHRGRGGMIWWLPSHLFLAFLPLVQYCSISCTHPLLLLLVPIILQILLSIELISFYATEACSFISPNLHHCFHSTLSTPTVFHLKHLLISKEPLTENPCTEWGLLRLFSDKRECALAQNSEPCVRQIVHLPDQLFWQWIILCVCMGGGGLQLIRSISQVKEKSFCPWRWWS